MPCTRKLEQPTRGDVPPRDQVIEAVAHAVPQQVGNDGAGPGLGSRAAEHFPCGIAMHQVPRNLVDCPPRELPRKPLPFGAQQAREERRQPAARPIREGRDECCEAPRLEEGSRTVLGVSHVAWIGKYGAQGSSVYKCRLLPCALSAPRDHLRINP